MEQETQQPQIDLSGWDDEKTNVVSKVGTPDQAPQTAEVNLDGWDSQDVVSKVGTPDQTTQLTDNKYKTGYNPFGLVPITDQTPQQQKDSINAYLDSVGTGKSTSMFGKTVDALKTVPARIATDTTQSIIDLYQFAHDEITDSKSDRIDVKKLDPYLNSDIYRNVEKGTAYDQVANVAEFMTNFANAGTFTDKVLPKVLESMPKTMEVLNGAVKSGIAGFQSGDPYQASMANLAYQSIKATDPSNDTLLAKAMHELVVNPTDSAIEAHLKQAASEMFMSGLGDLGLNVVGKAFKAGLKVFKSGDSQAAADIVNDTIQHVAQKTQDIKASLNRDGTLTDEAKLKVAADNQRVKDLDEIIKGDNPKVKQAEVNAATNEKGNAQELLDTLDEHPEVVAEKQAAEKSIDDLDAVKFKPKEKPAIEGEAAPLNATHYRTDIPEIDEAIKDIEEGRKTLSSGTVVDTFQKIINNSESSQAVYDKLNSMWASRPDSFTKYDGAFAQHAYDKASNEYYFAIKSPQTTQAEKDIAYKNLQDMATQRMKAAETYGSGNANIRWSKEATTGASWEQLASAMRESGVSEDDISKMSPHYKKIIKRSDEMKEEVFNSYKKAGESKEEILQHLETIKPKLDAMAEKEMILAKRKAANSAKWAKARLAQSELMLNNPSTAESALLSGVWRSYSRPILTMSAGALRAAFGGDTKAMYMGAYAVQSITRHLFASTTGLKAAAKAAWSGKGVLIEETEHGVLPKWALCMRGYTGMDEYFKQANYRAMCEASYRVENKAMLASAASNAERRSLINSHIDSLIENGYAVDAEFKQYAEETTFSQRAPNDGLAKLNSIIGQYPLLRMVVFPFTHTPFNMLRYAIRQTPLGLFTKDIRFSLQYGSHQEKTEILMAWTLWGGVGAWMGHKLMNCEATGAYPSDPKKREEQQAANIPAYAIKIGGIWISYDKADFGTPLKMLADMLTTAKTDHDNDVDILQTAGDTMFAGVKGIIDNSMMQQLGKAIDAMSGGEFSMKAENYLMGILTRPIPPTYTKIMQSIYNHGDIQEAQTPLERIERKATPWLLADRVDPITGKPVLTYSLMNIKYATNKTTDLLHARLFKVGGITTVSNDLGNGVKLDGKQLTDLQKIITNKVKDIHGRSLYKSLKDLSGTREFRELSSDRHGVGGLNWQQKAAQQRYNYFKNEGIKIFYKLNPDIYQQAIDNKVKTTQVNNFTYQE